MKTIITILLFLIPCLFALQGTAYAQQGQSGNALTVQQQGGKGFIMQFGNSHNSYKIDPAEAKERGFIRIHPDGAVDEETREKLRGQALRFHTGRDGSNYFEILHPDSVETITRRDFESFTNRKPTELPVDPIAELKAYSEQVNSEPFERLPVRIRSEGQSDNRLEVIVENRTDRPMKNLIMEPNDLPAGWKTTPGRHTAEEIPAYGSGAFTFHLEYPRDSGVERVRFQLQTDDLVFPWSARVTPAANGAEPVPDKFEVHGNYPNPFNPATTISYSLPEAMQVSVEIYNLIGQRVAVLVNQRQTAGTQNVVWDASGAASGTYIYRVTGIGESGNRVLEERKLTLIK